MNPITDFGWDKQEVHGDLLVKTGQGILHGITVNGITTVGDVAVYDGIDNSGVLIATLSLRTAVSVSHQGGMYLFDCKIVTGIYFDVTTFAGSLTATFI